MIVERIEPARKAGKPEDVAIGELKLELKEAKRTIRSLRKEVRVERAHATDMLMRMQEISTMAFELGARRLEECRCTPTRADILRR
jgi:hypothetical protein